MNINQMNFSWSKSTVFLLTLCTVFNLKAQNTLAQKLVESELQSLKKIIGNAELGFYFEDSNGKPIAAFQKDHPLIPASTLKVLTTGAVLSLLGRDFKYKTFIEHDGYIDRCGVLQGNLIIRGTGDPVLGSDRIPGNLSTGMLLNKVGDKIKSFGITEVKGNIIADNSFFLDCLTPDSWPYSDRGNYYGAAPSGLNLGENLYRAFFTPGKTLWSPAVLSGTDPPEIPFLLLKNEVLTNKPGTGDQAIIWIDSLNSPVRKITGTIPGGVNIFSIKGSVPDPAELFADLMKKELLKKGVWVGGESASIFNLPSNHPSNSRNLIVTYSSPPLAEILKQVNMRSHNLFAETLLVTMGRIFRNKGDIESGLQVMIQYWESKGVSLKNVELFDGSGLSPLNKITVHSLTHALKSIQTDSVFDHFRNSLPVAGETGTIKNFCKNTSAKGKVFAKSGSIAGVRSYAGFIQSPSGSYLPFSLIINNYEGSNAALTSRLEKLMVAMTKHP